MLWHAVASLTCLWMLFAYLELRDSPAKANENLLVQLRHLLSAQCLGPTEACRKRLRMGHCALPLRMVKV